jgi:glutamate--cysteine ligase
MIDRYVVGGFYRVHSGRGKDENLNAPGMHFEPLAFETSCCCRTAARRRMRRPTVSTPMASLLVWRLLAASLELERTEPAAEE